MRSETEKLLKILEAFCSGDDSKLNTFPENFDFGELLYLAENHKVLPFLYGYVHKVGMPEPFLNQVEKSARQTVLASYRRLFTLRDILREMESAGIGTVVLKGFSVSRFFPEPEVRKSSDIDILITDKSKFGSACEVLEKMGFRPEKEQNSSHHRSFSFGNVETELHTMFTEPFDNEEMNSFLENELENIADYIVVEEIMGVSMPVFRDGFNAYSILLHMLGHYLRSGFGLKFLCDWSMFWNREVDETETECYLKLVRESKIKGFSDMVTLACVEYLGLDSRLVEILECEKLDSVKEFMEETALCGEFGKEDKNRMVALRSGSIKDLFREFHHQMHLRFPKAGKCFVIWPILWMITLVCFLVNNVKIRKVSTLGIIGNARKRGKITKEMKLFSK